MLARALCVVEFIFFPVVAEIVDGDEELLVVISEKIDSNPFPWSGWCL